MSKSTRRSKKQRSGGSVDPAPLSEARSLWPPRRLIVSLCSLAAAAALVRAGLLESVVGGIVDGAVRNIITLILGFSALMSAVLWFVRESGHGQLIDNEAELASAFDTGAILQLARAKRRPMLYDLVYSALTLDLATPPSP